LQAAFAEFKSVILGNQKLSNSKYTQAFQVILNVCLPMCIGIYICIAKKTTISVTYLMKED